MFFHIFKYKVKYMLKDKMSLFWVFLWPLILSTFFYMAFSNIGASEKFEKIDVAVTNYSASDNAFFEVLDNTEMFIVTKTDIKDAKKKLDEGKVSGIINLGDKMNITVSKSGLPQSIIKSVLDSYQRVTSTVNGVIQKNPEVLKTNFLNELKFNNSYTKQKPIGNTTNPIVISFYSLLAMAALMGGTLAISDIECIQANQSSEAARVNVSPTHKLKAFTASISATILFHFLSMLFTFAYLAFVLKVEFGNNAGLIILLLFVGCFTGIMLGAMISSFIKKSNGIKVAVIITATLFGSFLAGMNAVDVKYYVQNKFPLVAYLNPANLITDAFYSLYYYSSNGRYFLNLIILSAFGVVSCIVTYFVLRRQKYASI